MKPTYTCSKCQKKLEVSQFTKHNLQRGSERKCTMCVIGRSLPSSSSKESSKHEQDDGSYEESVLPEDEHKAPKQDGSVDVNFLSKYKDQLFPPSRVEIYFRAIKQMNDMLRK